MNSSISTTKENNYDLLIIPQAGATIPGKHLTEQEANDAVAAWRDYGNKTPHSNTTATWKVAVAHIINGQPTITSTLTIPTHLEQHAPHPVKHADNAASTPASSAPPAV